VYCRLQLADKLPSREDKIIVFEQLTNFKGEKFSAQKLELSDKCSKYSHEYLTSAAVTISLL